MNIARSDIKLRFSDDGDVTVWIAEQAVIHCCGVSDDYLRQACRERYKQSLSASWRKVSENHEYFLGDSGKAWRYGYREGRFWYDYDRVPDRAPTFYRSQLPLKSEIVEFMREAGGNMMSREREVQLREDVLEQVSELVKTGDVDYYQDYPHEVTGKRIYNVTTATELAQSVAWILWIKENLKTNRFHELGFQTIKDFYGWVASDLAKRKLKGLEITTARSLRNKVSIMPDERSQIRRMLVGGKYCNQNAAILGKKQLFVDEETLEKRANQPQQEEDEDRRKLISRCLTIITSPGWIGYPSDQWDEINNLVKSRSIGMGKMLYQMSSVELKACRERLIMAHTNKLRYKNRHEYFTKLRQPERRYETMLLKTNNIVS